MSSSQADRRRQLAMRSFPPRWRERHGDEFLHVSNELAGTPDATRRELLDIVRGGLSVRRHDRPPLGIRLKYRLLERPVPPTWHAWMRDDLRGRFLGLRRGLPTLSIMCAVLVTVGLVFPDSFGQPGPGVTIGIWAAVFAVGAPFTGRRLRRRMNRAVGYDIVEAGLLPPPVLVRPRPLPPPRQPASRASYVRYGAPLSLWSSLTGWALLLGAGFTNQPDRTLGPFRFTPDPNSPLTSGQVSTAAVIVAVTAIVVAVTTAIVTRRRTRALPGTTAHASFDISGRWMWLASSALGAPMSVIGGVGAMPDLASVAAGASLALLGTAGGAAAIVVGRRNATLGREISLAELFVGERVPIGFGITSGSTRA